jgi:hypothetical protein
MLPNPKSVPEGGRLVHLYEATNQPEKVHAWREKLKAKDPSAAAPRAR